MPWPPKIFWVGLIIYYGFVALCWIGEATAGWNHIPGAVEIYAALLGTWIVPVILSVIYFYFPEKAEAEGS